MGNGIRYYAQKFSLEEVDKDKQCKVFVGNHVIEIATMDRVPSNINRYRKLTGGQYIDTETGEVLQNHSHSDGRSQRQQGLQKSFIALRRMINFNFYMEPNEKHITLTYRDEMRDYRKAGLDFKQFWSRFHYSYPDCEYIRIIEPQQSGNWHIHTLVKQLNDEELFVPVDDLSRKWRNGFVNIIPMPQVDNYGAYFSAYLADLDVCEESEISIGGVKPSMLIKGERLKFYPPNYKLYACSRGIIRPAPQIMTHGQAMELVQGEKLHYGYTNYIFRVDGESEPTVVNKITYAQYVLGRSKRS